jgi:hypothetical protein
LAIANACRSQEGPGRTGAMDSLYEGYPFDSLLFWISKHRLKVERNLVRSHCPKMIRGTGSIRFAESIQCQTHRQI